MNKLKSKELALGILILFGSLLALVAIVELPDEASGPGARDALQMKRSLPVDATLSD